MANINDFKIINARSIKKFEQAVDELQLKDSLIKKIKETQKTRLGFYFLTLEVLTGVSDFRTLDEYIIDCDYNKLIHDNAIDDLGIDAVYIDENDGNHTIYLFTYKFREKFNPDKTQAESAFLNSNKFLSYVYNMEINDDVKSLDKKVQDFIRDIISKLKSNTPWEIVLYSISNENQPFDKRLDPIINNYKKTFGLSTKSITLNEITAFLSERKSDKKCSFIVDKKDLLMYKVDDQATDCSYVVRINLIDVIRLCCNDDELSKNYSLEDDNEVANSELEKSLLFDNIRGYLGQTNYNKNIKGTIIEEPEKFFMFNNGITITTSYLEAKQVNSGAKMLFELNDYQLVNGGQTINTIFEYLQSDDGDKIIKLRQASVLVRIFKVSDAGSEVSNFFDGSKSKGTLKNRIAEYTNSQNSINPQDLKSVSSLQILIQQFLAQKDIEYIRKAGIEPIDKCFNYRITMDQLTKLLYSCQGYPERVTNQKRKLYIDYYDGIYAVSEGEFDFDGMYEKITCYFRLRDKFSTYTEQRIYYLIYLIYRFKVNDEKANDLLNDTLDEYKFNGTTPSRALIQKGFKDNLDETVKKNLATV